MSGPSVSWGSLVENARSGRGRRRSSVTRGPGRRAASPGDRYRCSYARTSSGPDSSYGDLFLGASALGRTTANLAGTLVAPSRGLNGGELLFFFRKDSPRNSSASRCYAVAVVGTPRKRRAHRGDMLASRMRSVALPPIRFGPFEVNMRSGELFRQGSRVRLPHQQFQVLALLLERRGEVATREELRNHLWPNDVVVDFDLGLNKAVNGLRGALRDRAEKPRFIETLPKRGYRFIAAIESGAPAAEHPLAADNAAPRRPPRIESVAVLPLDNLSGDPGQEYFSDGMTDELIAAVAQIDSVRVISRTSVMTYKGTHKSLRTIANELGVNAIVEGSVERPVHRVRISAQLIYAHTDRHLWSERYERELRDILHLQAEIAHSIASQIQRVVDPEHAYPAPAREVHPQAYEAYLKGIYFRDKFTPGDQ